MSDDELSILLSNIELSGRYKAPVSVPAGNTCYQLQLPDDDNIRAAFYELAGLLSNPDVWQDTAGGLTALETAEICANTWQSLTQTECPPEVPEVITGTD